MNLLDFIRRLVSDGAAILYTTHYLEEAETLCQRIGIIDHGRLHAEGTLSELQNLLGGDRLFVVEGALEGADPDAWPGFSRAVPDHPEIAATIRGHRGGPRAIPPIVSSSCWPCRCALERDPQAAEPERRVSATSPAALCANDHACHSAGQRPAAGPGAIPSRSPSISPCHS